MNLLRNKWSIVLVLFLLLFTIILVSQCKSSRSEWRYEIHGLINCNGEERPATWYTNSIHYGENFLRYWNSDGTEVIIPAPYVVIDYQYHTVKKDKRSYIFD